MPFAGKQHQKDVFSSAALNSRTNELQLLRKGGVSARSEPAEVHRKAPVSRSRAAWVVVRG